MATSTTNGPPITDVSPPEDERGPDASRRHDLPVDPDVTPSDVVAVLASQWDVLLVIATGGALGSVARWGIGEAFTDAVTTFPRATFLENVSGGLLLGVLMVFVVDVWSPSRYVRPFLGVGVLGGFTTFSTYMLDTRSRLAADHSALAATYLFGTLFVGLLAVWIGIAGARAIVARRGGPR